MKQIKNILIIIFIAIFIFLAWHLVLKNFYENIALKQIIERLSASSRIAQVMVTNVKFDEKSKKTLTTIKFVEYDTKNKPLPARYFTFPQSIIHFESLVIRFDDFYVKKGYRLRGRSAYLFWKAFAIDGSKVQSYDLAKIDQVPQGYKVGGLWFGFERSLWKKFWKYALEPQDRRLMGIKNAQIEAPATRFIPGIIYTIKIEHNAGMRIDTSIIPHILKGEKLPL
jgi:hypothetical protein